MPRPGEAGAGTLMMDYPAFCASGCSAFSVGSCGMALSRNLSSNWVRKSAAAMASAGSSSWGFGWLLQMYLTAWLSMKLTTSICLGVTVIVSCSSIMCSCLICRCKIQ